MIVEPRHIALAQSPEVPLLRWQQRSGLRYWVFGSLVGVFYAALLLGIVLLPMRGIRKRVQSTRGELLATLDRRLEALNSSDLGAASPETLRDMDTILDMRERVAQAPSWPVDLAGVRRILLYIVLPPLTWSAAALVELVIDNAVGG